MKKKLLVIVVAVLILLSTVLVACNKDIDFSVNFEVDGEIYHTITTMGDETITMPPNPTKDDYIFQGWYWDKDVWNEPFTANSLANTPLSDNMTVYARWISEDEAARQFTVSFNSMGGSGVSSITLENNSLIAQPSNPTRNGYIFVGWFKEADHSTRWNFTSDKVQGNITLYAKWATENDMNSVEIVRADGISQSGLSLFARVSNATTKYSIHEHLEANPYATVKVYEDDKGQSELALGTVDLTPGDNIVYVMITSGNGTIKKLYTLTIHRNYIYNVTYVFNNGSSNKNIQAEEGSKLSAISTGQKTGYTFVEWQVDGSKWDFESDIVNGNMILEAVWLGNLIEITFNSNGGNSVASKKIRYGDTFNFEVPTKTHYDFVGWTFNGNAITNNAGNSLQVWNINSPTTLYGDWQLHNYQITYHDTYSAQNNNPSSFTFETETIDLTALPDTNGLRFVEWQNGNGDVVTSITKGTGEDIVLTAKWDYIEYDLTFYLGDGQYKTGESNPSTYTKQDSITFVEPISNKAGYEFDGWYDNVTGGNKHSGIAKGSTDDKTYYARYKITNYNITYLETYSAVNNNPNTYTIESETITLSSLTSRTGYNFVEWQNGSGEVVTSIPKGSTGNITLTAVWNIIDYNITYSNTFDIIHSNPITYNIATATITLEDLSGRTGYTFLGWYTSLSGGAKVIMIPTGSSGDKTLYARWDTIKYDIEYIGVYETNNQNPSQYTIESDFNLVPLSGRAGYEFIEWQDINDSKITKISAGTTGKLEIRAKWQLLNYDITYFDTKAMQNNNVTSYTYVSEPITLENLTSPTGYIFLGWYTSSSGGTKITTIPTGNSGDMTLYARWETIVYNVNYHSTFGATNPNPTTYTVESQTIILAPLTGRAGYNFVEWQNGSGEVIASIIAGSTGTIYLTAVWDILSYDITYNDTYDMENTNPTSYNAESATIYLTDLSGRTGYTFLGWYTASSGGTKITTIPTGSSGNMTLYARWETNTYTISLDRESTVNSYQVTFDGNGYAVNIPAQTITDSNSLLYPDIPSRTGYIFAGWYDNSVTNGEPYDFTAEIKTNIALFAKWVSSSSPLFAGENKSIYISGQNYLTYEFIPLVSGNITAYTSGSVDTYGYLYIGSSLLASNDDGGSGYNFSITYNVTAGTKYILKIRGYGSGSNGSATLYLTGATKPNDSGGVAALSNAVSVTYNQSYNLGIPGNIAGYTFDGWYTEINGGGTKLTDSTGASLAPWTIDDDTVVYSGYTRNEYTVNFVTNLGSSIAAATLYYGDRLDLNTYVTTRDGYSFTGWYLDINDTVPYEATTMPDNNLTLNAKWIVYNLNDFKYDTTKIAVSEFETINADLFEAVLFDSDGELVAITATVNGTQIAGETISVRLLATGKYSKVKQLTINNIKVYGNPTLSYDTEKDYFSLSDTLDASLWTAGGTDTYGEATNIVIRVLQEVYSGGDLVTVIIESIDIAGNITSASISNVKVYDNPIITYYEDRLAIKESDEIGNALWNVSAVDNFGEVLTTTTSIINGTKAAGNTITVRISASDIKGNINNIDLIVKVYGAPTINSATKTDFKVSDTISVSSTGVIATDSHNGLVANVIITLKNGTQTAGSYMTYTVTATDIVDNIATKDITVKIYDIPSISTTKQGIKTTDDTNSIATFAVTSKDSFGTSLTVSYTLKSGSQMGGTSIIYTFTATDNAGNTVTVDYSYRVYDESDISISFMSGASNIIKLTSSGEEFSATATDSFGEACIIAVLKSDGTPLVAGTTTNIILRATDIAGNYKDSAIISNIKVYGTPTAQYAYDENYLKYGDNIEFMFTVRDSFGVELYANIVQTAYTDNIRYVTVTATDDAGNGFVQDYELYQLAQNQSYLALYYGDIFVDYGLATNGENYTLPCDFAGYDVYWTLGEVAITDSLGNSLAPWDKSPGGYILQADMTLITYTVDYNLNGGENSPDNPATFTVLSIGGAEGVITLNNPTKVTDIVTINSENIGNGQYRNTIETTGYTFLGWYTESDFVNRVFDLSIALGSATLFAKWSSETTTTTTTTTTTAYQRINASGEPTANGNYILFGEYPQTIKASNVSVGTTADSRGYYLGDDGYYYAKVTATPYSSYTFSTGTTVTSGTVYYFKVEPIKWRILSESNGNALILCESIIANKRYHASSNNYMNSEIRAWLNNEFYNTAFSDLQQQLIQVTNVDNSVYSTGYSSNPYACANTNDKIFLPSYREMVNTAYGFPNSANSTATRERLTSDYSRATGAYMSTSSSYYGNGYWWLRSPDYDYSYFARYIYSDGYVNYGSYVSNTLGGVVPALTIKLS